MKLTANQMDALKELGRFESTRPKDTPFWWRKASMAVLAEQGYVSTWSPYEKTRKIMAYRLTDAGRRALSEGGER